MTDGPRSAPARPRRRHPALGARIAATGLSITGMLGIVAVLGAQNPATSDGTTAASPTPQPPVAESVDAVEPAPQQAVVPELSGQPIPLTATPVVRVAPAPEQATQQATPVARTNGSR